MHKIEVENLKCNGCAGTIKKGLNAIEGLSDLSVDIESKVISFHSNEELIDTVKRKLSKLGYPEKGTGTGFQKAKSYVSCAIGKIES